MVVNLINFIGSLERVANYSARMCGNAVDERASYNFPTRDSALHFNTQGAV